MRICSIFPTFALIDPGHNFTVIREAVEGGVPEYLALTDHSPNLRVANGLTAERLATQLDPIASLNGGYDAFRDELEG